MDQHPFSYDDLLDYLVGHLDTERSAQFAEHLHVCQDCATTIIQFNTIRTLLRTDDSQEPPPRAVSRAQALFPAYHPASRPQQPRWRFSSPIVAFSAGFVLALLLLFGFGSMIADQDIAPDSPLYPVKAAVQGLRVVVSNIGKTPSAQARPTITLTPGVSPAVPGPSPVVPGASPVVPSASPVPPGASPPATQQSSTAIIVISQIYGGGGNTGAPFTHDFIELFNRGNTPVSLAGWSLQYASAAGTGNFGAGVAQITELPAVTLAPGQYLLIQQARGSGGAAPLPAPDFIDATPIALSAVGGKVALVRTATSLGCNGGTTPCPPSALANIVDLVGYGRTDFYEGMGPAPESSNTTAVVRIIEGCMDTNNNLDDFILSAPNPRNSMFPKFLCPPATPQP